MSEKPNPDTARLALIRARHTLTAEARRIHADTRAAFRLAITRTQSDLETLERSDDVENPAAQLDEIRSLVRVRDARLEAKHAALDARRSQIDRCESNLGHAIHGEQIDLFPAEHAAEVNTIPALVYLPAEDRLVEAGEVIETLADEVVALEAERAQSKPKRKRAPPRAGASRNRHKGGAA